MTTIPGNDPSFFAEILSQPLFVKDLEIVTDHPFADLLAHGLETFQYLVLDSGASVFCPISSFPLPLPAPRTD
jgi:hypothetical protein